MTANDREKLIRRYTDELWNKGNVDVIDDVFDARASIHDPSFPVDGIKGVKDQARELRASQPDLHIDVHDVLVAGDLTASRFTMRGTAKKEFRGLPATGKSYAMSGISVHKWQNDRIVEQWTNYDLLGALQQLGIIPQLAQQRTNA